MDVWTIVVGVITGVITGAISGFYVSYRVKLVSDYEVRNARNWSNVQSILFILYQLNDIVIDFSKSYKVDVNQFHVLYNQYKACIPMCLNENMIMEYTQRSGQFAKLCMDLIDDKISDDNVEMFQKSFSHSVYALTECFKGTDGALYPLSWKILFKHPKDVYHWNL